MFILLMSTETNSTLCRKITIMTGKGWAFLKLNIRSSDCFRTQVCKNIIIEAFNIFKAFVCFRNKEGLEKNSNELFISITIHQYELGGIVEMTNHLVSVSIEDNLGVHMLAHLFFPRFYSTNFDNVVSYLTALLPFDIIPIFDCR